MGKHTVQKKTVAMVIAVGLILLTTGCEEILNGENGPYIIHIHKSAGGEHTLHLTSNLMFSVSWDTGVVPEGVSGVTYAKFVYNGTDITDVGLGTYNLVADSSRMGDLKEVEFGKGLSRNGNDITVDHFSGSKDRSTIEGYGFTLTEYDKIESGWLKIAGDNVDQVFSWRFETEAGTVLSGSYTTAPPFSID